MPRLKPRSLLGLMAVFAAACAVEPRSALGPADGDAGAASGVAAEASARPLPAGAGREILTRDCTGCHDLNGLWAYQGYYDEARWRDMIATMVAHGADLDAAEIDVLAAYLVEHFGPGTR